MADSPTIKYSGQGTRGQAAELGQTVSRAMQQAVVGRSGPLHLDTLRVQVPAGAGTRDIERLIRREIERRAGRGRA
jgi:hypothetical protein